MNYLKVKHIKIACIDKKLVAHLLLSQIKINKSYLHLDSLLIQINKKVIKIVKQN